MIEYIGFGSLPDIVHRKTVKKGFEFTLMVVGESGLGKSTLINTLFLSDLYKDRKESSYGMFYWKRILIVLGRWEGCVFSPLAISSFVIVLTLINIYVSLPIFFIILEPPQTAKVEKKTLCIEEQGVKLRLTVVDTPGKYSIRILIFFLKNEQE